MQAISRLFKRSIVCIAVLEMIKLLLHYISYDLQHYMLIFFIKTLFLAAPTIKHSIDTFMFCHSGVRTPLLPQNRLPVLNYVFTTVNVISLS